MAYVAVKGGTEAIEASINLLNYERVKNRQVLEIDTILATMQTLVDQVMSESSLYSPFLAALAIKQAEGSMEEAVFLLRAHRSTLPRLYTSEPVDTNDMFVKRRISASFKDIIGGQMLGATPDYKHRLLDFDLIDETIADIEKQMVDYKNSLSIDGSHTKVTYFPKVVETLREEGLFPTYPLNDTKPVDVTKENIQFPVDRSARLQMLSRGQTGAVTSIGYASLRGYGAVHPTVGEVRYGAVPIHVQIGNEADEDDDTYYIGEIHLSEVESFVPVTSPGEKGEDNLNFEIGYGACFGKNETKTIAMSILDQCLEHPEVNAPPHDEEFVLLHIDTVESTGFISHLKLPHYVTFQSKLDAVRNLKKEEERDANAEAR